MQIEYKERDLTEAISDLAYMYVFLELVFDSGMRITARMSEQSAVVRIVSTRATGLCLSARHTPHKLSGGRGQSGTQLTGTPESRHRRGSAVILYL